MRARYRLRIQWEENKQGQGRGRRRIRRQNARRRSRGSTKMSILHQRRVDMCDSGGTFGPLHCLSGSLSQVVAVAFKFAAATAFAQAQSPNMAKQAIHAAHRGRTGTERRSVPLRSTSDHRATRSANFDGFAINKQTHRPSRYTDLYNQLYTTPSLGPP